MLNVLLTFAVGYLGGWLLSKLKVPGGMMVGAVLGAAILNVSYGMASMPVNARVVAQCTAGAFIGCSVKRSDLERLKFIFKPAVLLLSSMLALNLTLGFLIHWLSPLDLLTSLMSAVPGGMTDTPLIAADLGADAAKVAVLQFVRMVSGIGLFPSLIAWVDRKENGTDIQSIDFNNGSESDLGPKKGFNRFSLSHLSPNLKFAVTISVAVVAGFIGRASGVTAGTLLFSLVAILALKLTTNVSYIPMWAKRLAQVLAGCYIGSGIYKNDLLELRFLVVPALLILAGYFVNCYLTGHLLQKTCKMELKEGMLAATPAGATDMALISCDLGVQSTDLIVLQVIRMLVVISVFPQIISLIVKAMA